MRLLLLLMTSAALAQAAPLATVAVVAESMPLERRLEGVVEAVHQSTVSAETKGRVAEIYVDVGDQVPAGTVILSLVGVEQRESLRQAEAALAEARAGLAAQEQDYRRIKEIYDRRLTSKADLDRATAAYNTMKARVASAEAALKSARAQVDYTEVKAPYSGVVSARHVEPGEAVLPGTPLMTGFDPDALRVLVDVPQAVAEQVKERRAARVLVADDRSITPDKLVLFPTAAPITSTLRTRLDLPTQAAGLYPGQFVEVAFTVGEAERLLVPASALVYRSEITGLYVMNEGRPELRQVRVGHRFGDRIEILSGVRAGEQIAADPVAAGIAVHGG